MANGTRFVIIPLENDKRDIAYNGEIISNKNNGEFYLKTPDGIKNAFRPVQFMMNQLYTESNICVWSEGGFTGSFLHTTLDGKYNPIHIPGANSIDPDYYSVFAVPGSSEIITTLGEYWVVKDECTITMQSTGIPSPSNCHFDYLVLKFGKMKAYDPVNYPIKTGFGMFKSNTATLTGYNNVTIPTQGTTDYRVFILPTNDTNGDLGEVYVSKNPSAFAVRNTGNVGKGANVAPDVNFDYLFFGDNVDNLYDPFAFPIQTGPGVFSTDGVTRTVNGRSLTVTTTHVTFPREVPDIPYIALIQPTDAQGGRLGDFVVVNKTTTGFDVLNSGNNTASRFDWMIMHSSYITSYEFNS